VHSSMCWSLSAVMRPSLKRLNHSLIWVTPIATSLKACWILWIIVRYFLDRPCIW
jgi:hypothetical protein